MIDRFISYFKRNTYFMISVIALGVSIVFGATLFLVFTFGEQTTKTTVGHIYLGDVRKSQYATVINRELDQFFTNASYELIYQNRTVSLDFQYFSLDSKTIDDIKENNKNPLYLKFEDDLNEFNATITNEFGSVVSLYLDYDLLINTISSDLEQFKYQKTYYLRDFLKSEGLKDLVIYQLDLVDEALIDQIIDEVISFEIKGEQRFSVLNAFKEFDLSNEALSVIASGLLTLSLDSPFVGYVYTPHNIKPSYQTLTSDVRILKINDYDLSFYNPLEISFYVHMEKVGSNKLEFRLESYQLLDQYQSSVNVYEEILPKEIYITNTLLDEFTPEVIITEDETSMTYKKLVTPGVKGYVYQVKRTVTVSGLSHEVVLFNLMVPSSSSIYEQNVVAKEGI